MKTYKTAVLVAASMLLAGCSDAYKGTELGPGKTADNPDEYYAGGKLGTTALVNAYAYQQPTQAVENAGLDMEFQNGETLFERDFNYNTGSDLWLSVWAAFIAILITDMESARTATVQEIWATVIFSSFTTRKPIPM